MDRLCEVTRKVISNIIYKKAGWKAFQCPFWSEAGIIDDSCRKANSYYAVGERYATGFFINFIWNGPILENYFFYFKCDREAKHWSEVYQDSMRSSKLLVFTDNQSLADYIFEVMKSDGMPVL